MVKKPKREPSQLEKQMTNQSRELDEDFVQANDFLTNDAFNEDEENFNDRFSDQKDDELYEKLRSIDGRKTKKLRTEIGKSELDVNITDNDTNSIHKIKTYELLHSLKDISETGALKKLFAKTHKRTKTLDTPLPKFISEKAQRIASYAEDKKEISKWDPIVKRNRKTEQLVFPLKQPDYSMQTVSNFTQSWKPETEMEKQVAELLKTSENNLKDQKLLTQAEMKAIEAMNLDELKQRRQEFLKLKALQQYQESKFKRVKNIKSKRYRKILRKEREKQETREMETLEKEDPMKFRQVLESLEKQRIKERMSLKHKGTTKWAKKQAQYAKYNEKARELVQEQLDLAKQLTKKVKPVQRDSDDEDEGRSSQNKQSKNPFEPTAQINIENALLANNPWMKMMSGLEKIHPSNDGRQSKNGEGIGASDADYSQPKAFTNKLELSKAQKDLDVLDEMDDDDDYELSENDEMKIDRSNIQDLREIFDKSEEVEEDANETYDEKSQERFVSNKKQAKKQRQNSQNELNKEKENNIEPTNNIDTNQIAVRVEEKNIKPLSDNNTIKFNRLSESDQSSGPQTNFNKNQQDKKSHQLTLSEAFADDDVIEEFKAEKSKIVESERVKSIDLTKPGWGGWAGAGIDAEEEKKKLLKKLNKHRKNRNVRKKLIIRPQDVLKSEEDKKQMQRRDKDLSHVIISEKKDTTIAKFQISELPHQFKSVHEFESKIAQPVGRTWNPDFKFRKLITPKVKTKIGAIIEPIDKTDMINLRKKKY